MFTRICTVLLILPLVAIGAGMPAQDQSTAATRAAGPWTLRGGALRSPRPTSVTSPSNAMPRRAEEFSLSAVKLLDSPFRRAMETDKAYLLRLDPDRLLAGFRREAGLPTAS